MGWAPEWAVLAAREPEWVEWVAEAFRTTDLPTHAAWAARSTDRTFTHPEWHW